MIFIKNIKHTEYQIIKHIKKEILQHLLQLQLKFQQP